MQIFVSVLLVFLDFEIAIFSISAFVMPIALTGYTALSVLRQTTFFTLFSMQQLMMLLVPKILVFTASRG